jgi:hypothetical protein
VGLRQASLGAGQGGIGEPRDGLVLCCDFSKGGECNVTFASCAKLPSGQNLAYIYI